MPSSRALLRPAILVLLKEEDDYGYALAEQRDTVARLVHGGLGRPVTQPSRRSTSPAGYVARALHSV